MLVQADREHPRVVPEGRLHAVAVMHVDVDVGDPLGALPKEPGNGDRGVVVDAKSARVAAHGVMQTARDAGTMRGRSGPDRPRGSQRRPGHEGRRLMHMGKDRVILGAEAAGKQRRGIGPGGCVIAGSERARRLDHGDVARIVDELKLGVGCGRGRRHRNVFVAQHAEGLGQLHRELDPDRRQRMTRPEVVSGQLFIPGDVQGTDHRAVLSEAVPLACHIRCRPRPTP